MGRTAILNGFGRTLGDSIIGLQALFTAQKLGVIGPHPTLFRLPGLPPLIEQTYRLAEFATVEALPWDEATPHQPFAPASAFARVIDIRDFAFDPEFRGRAMIDYFLAKLGADPDAVPSGQRRNLWLRGRVQPHRPVPGGHILICPQTASPLRTMPDAVHDHIHAWLERETGLPVLTQARLPRATTMADLCGLIAGARLVVSADTAMVHLADAFDVPTLAFFTTHRPAWRVRDYAHCRAVHLAPEGLPDALEFIRGDPDIAACEAAWFAPGRDFAWLDRLLAETWEAAQ
jgi:hypothetical protein